MQRNKLLLLLVLLMTAATGAWAQDAKHLITATCREQTRSLEQPLPYATTIGELYEAVTGESFSSLISFMSTMEMPLTGITSNNTSAVSIGELNGASTPVTVIADGKATISINFGSYAHGIFVSATSPLYAYMKDGVKDADKWTVKVGDGLAQALPIGGLKGDGSETVTLQYTGRLKVKGVTATVEAPAEATPALSITSPSVGQVIGSDGKNYDYGSLPTGVTAVAKICYVSGSNGLALALTDEGQMNWSTAMTTCAAHTPAFTGGTWKLASKDEWDNMINAAGSFTALRDGFSSVGGTNMQRMSDSNYWSSTEYASNYARRIEFVNGSWSFMKKDVDYYYVRACLAFTVEQSAKPAATVTTAPTGAAVVGVGKTTALVSGGVAEGGSMMYKVTTENTKPASTDGFSEAVPTAQSITASGKVYVWYYVKGDDTHSDSEIAAAAIVVPVADVVWDATNVSDLEVPGDAESYTKEGIKLSCNAEDVNAVWYEDEDPTLDGISLRVQASGGFTFTAPTGKKFTKIEMNAVYSNGWDGANLGTGWKFVEDDPNNIYKATWTGSASSTVDLLKDVDDFGGEPVKSIAFYLSE